MKINLETKFGNIEIDDNEIYYFPEGICGLGEDKKFTILNFKHENFLWLQSIDSAKIAMMVTEPFWFDSYYRERLEKENLLYKLKSSRFKVLVGCYYDRENKKIFANILAPFFIDLDLKIGRQIILNGCKDELNVDIIETLKKNFIKTAV